MRLFIANFYCSKDNDIESFLKEKAVIYESLGKARTFIVLDEDRADKELAILGYFSLAINILDVPVNLSNRKRKDLDGLSAKKNGEVIEKIPAILIGQLGKNDLFADKFSGSNLLDICLSKILEGQRILGGRIIMVECKPISKLIEFYEQTGFVVASDDVDGNKLLVLYRVLQEQEIVEV